MSPADPPGLQSGDTVLGFPLLSSAALFSSEEIVSGELLPSKGFPKPADGLGDALRRSRGEWLGLAAIFAVG